MARANFSDTSDKGIVKNRECECYKQGTPASACARTYYCSCAPARGFAKGFNAQNVMSNASCSLHDLDLPVGAPPVPWEAEIIAHETADPARAAALKRIGYRRGSPYYLEALKGEV